MKTTIILLILSLYCTLANCQTIYGRVYDKDTGKGIPKVSIVSQLTGLVVHTGLNGEVKISNPRLNDTLFFRSIGYVEETLVLSTNVTGFNLGLKPKTNVIEEVNVQTGYQSLRPDQLSGATQVLGESQLNQRTGANILDRLNHVANAVFFDNQLEASGNQKHNFSIRGLSTIDGVRDPLIVLDGFIYEGSIQNIDPNNIESITILKDAAASSIWGARAGNGVLVIKSKGAKETGGKTRFTFNKSIQLSKKPNLYDVYQMPSADFIDMERMLFKNGYYDKDIRRNPHNALSPAVKLFQEHKDGKIDTMVMEDGLKRLSLIDSRSDYMDYFMERPLIDQYAISLANGNDKNSVHLGIGYNYEKSQYADKNRKLNIDFNDRIKLSEKLRLDFGFKFTDARNSKGKPSFESLTYRNKRVPYMDLVDDNGKGLVLENTYDKTYMDSYLPGKLFSWDYIPYEDYRTSDLLTLRSEYLGQAKLSYQLLPFMDLQLSYQTQMQLNEEKNRHDVSSYYTRTLINTYAAYDISKDRMSYPVPIGDILTQEAIKTKSYNWRGQVDIKKSWIDIELSGIAGAEIRENKIEGGENTLYGYADDPLKNVAVDFISDFPIGINYSSGNIPGRPVIYASINRFISLYTNWNVEFKKSIGVTASMRRDGANIFGVSTNDKWTPFWSTGAYWIMPQGWAANVYAKRLKWRASYGINGNVDLRKTSLPVGEYSSFNYSPYTGLLISQLNDPNLRWEQIKTLNVALDFSFLEGRVSGNVDYYRKLGKDLYGMTAYDYTTWGYLPFITKNVASMIGEGWDIILDTDNVRGQFQWSTRFNVAFNKSKTKAYYGPYTMNASRFLGQGLSITALPGYPLYGIAGYKSGGLDGDGNPQGYLDGELSTDYSAIRTQAVSMGEDGNIVFKGSSKPQVFGSLINNFSYKNWNASVNISFLGDYYFMKNVTSYSSLFSSGKAYIDIEARWREPGDELKTSVPAMIYPLNQLRESFNTSSASNILRADQVRLEYIRLGYAVDLKSLMKIECFANISNIGLLWTSNKENIDPMYQNKVKPPMTFTLGTFIKL